MALERNEVRLGVSRHAARLFLDRGVAGTSGDDIAAASSISKRTMWRYFRTKESCVEPLFVESALRFAGALQAWPLDQSIEDFLEWAMRVEQQTPQSTADDILAVRLIALSTQEPDLRGVWLYACHLLEQKLQPVVSRRANRSVLDFDVRLCAATMVAAIRVVDESISNAAINEHQQFTHAEAVGRVASAIRAASTLPICDPILIANYR